MANDSSRKQNNSSHSADVAAELLGAHSDTKTDRGYLPLVLDNHINASTDVLPNHSAPVGEQRFYGVPFRIGQSRDAPALVLVGPGGHKEQFSIQVGMDATWLVFAHAMLTTDLYDGAIVGKEVMEFIFHFEDGSRECIPIRERFEIAVAPRHWPGHALPRDWGQFPFLALPDAEQVLAPRSIGRFDTAGAWLAGIDDPQTREPYILPYTYWLWAWPNPRPAQRVSHVEVVPGNVPCVIAGITASILREEPFTRDVGRDVLISLPDGIVVDEELEIHVDRGMTGYALRRAPADPAAYAVAGWGRPVRGTEALAYAKVAASPSAWLDLRHGVVPLGGVGWHELRSQGPTVLESGTAIGLDEAGQAWGRIVVVDADTGRPVPCRVCIRSKAGVPYPPYGHPSHINHEMGTWNLNIGGQVRLGLDTYAYIDGEAEGWLPLGDITVEVARGFEYEPAFCHFTISVESPNVRMELRRVPWSGHERWKSSDTHVHFISSTGAMMEARGEGLNIVNLLLSQWGDHFSNTVDFTGIPVVSPDGETIVYAAQENRQHMLGHLSLLGLTKQIAPWCTGGAEETEIGAGLETTMSHWADECRALDGIIIIPHFPAPNGEVAALIATGRADAVEFIGWDDYSIGEYYKYLNAGYQIPIAGGTDKMSAEVPIGLQRTYFRLLSDQELSYDAWRDSIRAGATFTSSGPLLNFSVGDSGIGATLPISRGSSVTVEASAISIFPLSCLEIVLNGEVVAHKSAAGAHEVSLTQDVEISRDSWIAVRCLGLEGAEGLHNDT